MGECWEVIRFCGAGEGNRTLVISLEGFCSTIELHPPSNRSLSITSPAYRFTRLLSTPGALKAGGGGWIRTNVGARPTDLQSAPFNRSGTPPGNSRLCPKRGASGNRNRRFPTDPLQRPWPEWPTRLPVAESRKPSSLQAPPSGSTGASPRKSPTCPGGMGTGRTVASR